MQGQIFIAEHKSSELPWQNGTWWQRKHNMEKCVNITPFSPEINWTQYQMAELAMLIAHGMKDTVSIASELCGLQKLALNLTGSSLTTSQLRELACILPFKHLNGYSLKEKKPRHTVKKLTMDVHSDPCETGQITNHIIFFACCILCIAMHWHSKIFLYIGKALVFRADCSRSTSNWEQGEQTKKRLFCFETGQTKKKSKQMLLQAAPNCKKPPEAFVVS